MDLRERLQYCKKCEKREFDRNVGIVCSLTKEKPSFQNTCDDYVMDKEAAKKVLDSVMNNSQTSSSYNYTTTETEEESNPIWVIIGIIIFIIKLVLIFGN